MLDAEQFVGLCKLARDTAEAVEKAAAGHRVVRSVLKGKAKRKPEQELPAVRDYRFALRMANRLTAEADRAVQALPPWPLPGAWQFWDLLTAANRTTRALGGAFDGPKHDLHAAAEKLRAAADAVEREALACVEPVPPVEPASLASIRAEALAMLTALRSVDAEQADDAAFRVAYRGLRRLAFLAGTLDATRPVPVPPPWAQSDSTPDQLIAKFRGTLTLPPRDEIQTVLRAIIAWCDDGERPAVAAIRSRRRKGTVRTANPETVAKDCQIAEAWAAGNYRTYRELADALGTGYTATGVRKALERVRKRKPKSTAN